MTAARPPLNWLRAFEAAARHGGFASAADELGVTPSAVSQHVRALERRLARPLFDRNANGVRLTPTGERYADRLRRGFALIDEATAALVDRRPRHSLVVHVTTSFATQWIAPRLDLFRIAHPGIDLRLTALGDDIEKGATDAAIRYGSGDWPALEATELARDEVFPVCAPTIAARLRNPRDVRRCELLHVPGYAEDWDAWLALAGVTAVDTSKGSFFDQSIMAIRAAIDGKGVMLGRSSLIQRELAAGLLIAPFEPRLRAGAYWFVATPRKARLPKVAAFRQWLLQMARGAPA